MPTTIVIENLLKQFPGVAGAAPSNAVDSVSLRIGAGELFFLLGPSGCGKTTLLRMIAGFIEPTKGTIRFDDSAGASVDVTHLPAEKRDTGMVFQSYALWPHMTVAQNVAFGLEVRKVPSDKRETLVREALAQVRMEHLAQRKPNQLSGGQQQRVALARAIVIKPRVLLLDEPLSNLDAKLRLELRSEIRRVCKASNITTVYVTHDQKEALSMADRIAIMRAGKVVQLGSPKELYHAPANRFVAEFLGETNIMPGVVESAEPGPASQVTIKTRTDAGALVSYAAHVNGVHKPGASVLVSLRHEALRPATPHAVNRLRARLTDTLYLGELSQHTLAIAGAQTPLVMATLNPAGCSTWNIGDEVECECAPEDVVLLPQAE